RGARPALSAQRVPGYGGRAARSGGGADVAGFTVGLRAGRGIGTHLFRFSHGGHRAVRPAGHETGAADGRDLRDDPVVAGAAGLGAAGSAGQPAELAQTVARVPLWPALS